MNSKLDQLAQELREALETRDLTRAHGLLAAYRCEFDRLWGAMSESERQQSTLPTEALDLLNWARSVAISVRQEWNLGRQGVRGARKYVGSAARHGVSV